MTEACTVTVDLLDAKTGDPTPYTMTPTLDAMKAVNRFNGGITGMFRKLAEFDIDSMVLCIVAGTGAKGNPAKVIEERVYATGVEAVQPKCVRFVNVIAAGGRDPDQVKAPEGAEGAPGNG